MGIHPYDYWGRDNFSGCGWDSESHFAQVMAGLMHHRNREAGPGFEHYYTYMEGTEGGAWVYNKHNPTFKGPSAVFDAIDYWNSISSYKLEITQTRPQKNYFTDYYSDQDAWDSKLMASGGEGSTNQGDESRVSLNSDFSIMLMGGYGAAAEMEGGIGAEILYDMDVYYHRLIETDGSTTLYMSKYALGPPKKYTHLGGSLAGYGLSWDVYSDAYYNDPVHTFSLTLSAVFGIEYQIAGDNQTLFIGLAPGMKGGLGLVGSVSGHLGINIRLK